MKLLLRICAVQLMASWTCEGFAAAATGSFTFDFASDPACSATVTVDCIDHFEVWDVTSSPKNWQRLHCLLRSIANEFYFQSWASVWIAQMVCSRCRKRWNHQRYDSPTIAAYIRSSSGCSR